MSHLEPSLLNEIVHHRFRLAILTVLVSGVEVEFTYLRQSLGLTDGNLGRHLEVLQEHGFISVRKQYNGRRARTWIAISDHGATALHKEALTLTDIVERIRNSMP